MRRTCEKCIHYDVCRYPLEYRANPDTCWKYEEHRPHGEWEGKHCDYGVYYRCSNCHKMPPNYECDYKEGAIKTNFCPYCGADMRDKKDDLAEIIEAVQSMKER